MIAKYKNNGRSKQHLSRGRRTAENYNPSIIILIFLFVSVVAGSIAAIKTDGEEYSVITKKINSSLSDFKPDNVLKAKVFTESIYKNSKTVLLIWAFSFFGAGAIASLFIICFKVFGIGYTVTLFIMEFGERGMILAVGSFLIQNIALITICLFIAKSSFQNLVASFTKKSFSYHRSGTNIIEQLVIFLIISLGIFIIGLYEAYICPWICNLLF